MSCGCWLGISWSWGLHLDVWLLLLLWDVCTVAKAKSVLSHEKH